MASLLVAALALGAAVVQAQSIHAINGKQFLSPYNGQAVTNVTGVVVAKAAAGLYLRSPKKACDLRVSGGLYVYSAALAKNASIQVGDTLTLDGTVTEYRSLDTYLYATELTAPVVQGWVSGGPAPAPLVLGTDTLAPPTVQYSALDNGDVLGVPNNVSRVSEVNPTLRPDQYGLDFWRSLHGELVTLSNPVAVSKPNRYGEIWMAGGSLPTTSRNARGGLTLTPRDSNPEAVLVGAPLDGTKTASTYRIGDTFANITGVVHYQFGFYELLPLTAPAYVASVSPALPPPTALRSTGTCGGLTVADYNIENFAPSETAHVQDVAAHIVDYLRLPDVLFVQEIQDNDGATDDGVVDAGATLAALAAAVAAHSGSGGLQYAYTWINPVNDADGGEPGGNIRQAYLYNPAVVRLASSPGATVGAGGPLDANAVVVGADGQPALKYNPGRIDPSNAAWTKSRKPLAAAWQTVAGGHVFFTVNVHWESKGGSSSLQGDPRPPVNSPVDKRTLQAQITGAFVAELLAADADARVVVAGDFNEFAPVLPVQTLARVSGLVDLDDAAAVPLLERYTYTFGSSMQSLDHVFVSPAIARRAARAEHVHVNSWVSYADQVSDHDPTVALLDVCGSHVSNSTASVPAGNASSSAPASASTLASTSTVAVATTSAASATSSAPSAAPTGKGHLKVVSPGVSSGGGLISGGTWYRGGGTPATYTATTAAGGSGNATFTLASSKGACAVLPADGSLSCASTVTTPSVFGYDGTYLTYSGTSVFYAAAVPSGSVQGTVYTTSDKGSVTLQVTWTAA